MSSLAAQIRLFDINTPKEEILSMISGFNPLPYKAKKGILVSCIRHPMTNPAMWIKYLSTGEVYYVHLPISYEIVEVVIDGPLPESKVPNYGDGPTWMNFDNFFRNLGSDFINSEFFKNSNFDASVEKSVVERISVTGLPVFRTPRDSYRQIVKEGFDLIASGDFHTAYNFVHFASHTGAYVIGGKNYHDESFAVFNYCCQDLGADACPSLRADHYWDVMERGRANIAYHTAGEVQSLYILSIQRLALEGLRKSYGGTALFHINNEMKFVVERLSDVTQKLLDKTDKRSGESYLNQALKYIPENKVLSVDSNWLSCPFCGSKVPAKDSSCPNCGAPSLIKL